MKRGSGKQRTVNGTVCRAGKGGAVVDSEEAREQKHMEYTNLDRADSPGLKAHACRFNKVRILEV